MSIALSTISEPYLAKHRNLDNNRCLAGKALYKVIFWYIILFRLEHHQEISTSTRINTILARQRQLQGFSLPQASHELVAQSLRQDQTHSSKDEEQI